MSRYLLSADGDTRLYAGWDNPLQTFFVQKYINYDKDNEEIVLEIGSRFKQCATLNNLEIFLLNNGYRLTEDFCERLYQDFESKHEPTPLQSWANDFFEGILKGKENIK
jgi:hypothetical protein